MSKIRDLFQKMKDKAKAARPDHASHADDSTAEHDISFNAQEEASEGQAPEFPDSDEDYTDSVDEIDLDEGRLSVKDRFHIGVTSLKDKINRVDFRKFKSPKIAESAGKQTPKPWSKDRLLGATKSGVSKLDSQKLKSFHIEIFSAARRNQIHKGFQYAVIFSTVFIVGKNAALFLKGPDSEPQARVNGSGVDAANALTSSDIDEIQKSGIFKTDAAAPVDEVKRPVIAEDIKCKKANRKSNLPIKLLNTVVLQDSIKSIASVQVRSGSELAQFREGDKISDMAKIDLIDRQQIIVKNLKDGNCEIIENSDQSRPSGIAVMSPSQSKAFKRTSHKVEGIKNEGNKYTIEKSFIQDKMKNISDVLTQARGIQLTNPDGTISFKIVDVEPGGIFSYLGVQNNDVITQINGKKISNLNEVMSWFGNISKVDKMSITVNRNGDEVPLDYNIQ